MNQAEQQAASGAVDSKTKGFRMKRALLDFAQDILGLAALSVFVTACVYGSAGMSALILAARVGQ